MNFSITNQQEQHIRAEVATGHYANASEYVRQAIREKIERDHLRTAKLHNLKAAIDEGFNSGPSEPLDIEAIIQEAEAERAVEQAS